MVKLIRGNMVNMEFPKYIFVLKKITFSTFPFTFKEKLQSSTSSCTRRTACANT